MFFKGNPERRVELPAVTAGGRLYRTKRYLSSPLMYCCRVDIYESRSGQKFSGSVCAPGDGAPSRITKKTGEYLYALKKALSR